MLKKVLFVISILVIFIVIFDAIFHHEPKKMQVVLGEKTFVMDIADTQFLQANGLSGVKSLPENGGMIFIFDKPDKYSFWMKDMNFPLDIIWISQNFDIVLIEKSIATSTYPKLFSPKNPALYVLEINAGQSDKIGLKIGDKVKIF